MKKSLVFIFCCCFAGLFLVACGSSENKEAKECESNLDCQVGKKCSAEGVCVKDPDYNKNAGKDKDGSELPDNTSSGDETDTGNETDTDTDTDSDDTDTTDSSDSATDDDDSGTDDSDSADSDSSDDDADSGDSDVDSDSDGDSENDDEDSDQDDNDQDEDTETDDDVEYCDTTCPALITDDGCLPAMESEKEKGLCNGMDDDCDGEIDEGCTCNVGDTQPCFSGKPKQRGVGICSDGIQNCIPQMRGVKAVKGKWGQCKNQILPMNAEVCDKADNNCNGCADEGLCCSPKIDCSYDIGTASPFADKLIDGTKIYDPANEYQDAGTATWEWTLTKGSCDIVLKKTSFSLTSAVEGVAGTSTDAADKITFSGVGLSKFNVNFQLSGTYYLHLKVTRENGEVYECEWPLKVASNGLRIELCWDTYSSIDVDLHLGKENKTTAWNNNSECYWKNCDTSRGYNGTDPDWGYLNTMNYDPATGAEKSMPNPRLDIDNRAEGEGAKPENINLDNPVENDVFKVLVHHYSPAEVVNGECLDWYHGLFVDICLEYEEIYTYSYPVVNVYCGGSLKATYGTGETGTQVSDFRDRDDSWEVVKIKWVGDPTSDECILTPNLKENNAQVPTFTDW